MARDAVRTSFRKGWQGALAAGAAVLLMAPVTATSAEYSSANQVLFMTNHLEEFTESGVKLEYEYSREGSWDDPFEDAIVIEITEVTEQGKTAEVELFSGERRRPFAPVQGANGNPALLAFLQFDVSEMGGQTEQPWQRFQGQIRSVLAYAEAEETEIEFEGETVDAKSVRLVPFMSEDGPAMDGEAQVYAEKRYEFILSEHVPGYIYQLRTELPNPEEGVDEPLMVDTMRFSKVSQDQ